MTAFLGNQVGLELRARAGFQRRTADSSSSPAFALDLAPVSYAAGRSSSFRVPSVFGALLPAVGLETMHDRPLALRLQTVRLSIGTLLTEWVLLELGASMLFRYELEESDQPSIGEFGFDSSLRMVVLF